MSLNAIEFVRVLASDAVKQDFAEANAQFKPVADLLRARPGLVDIYSGRQVEDSKYIILVVVWETVEHHLRFVADADEYPKLKAPLAPLVAGPLEITHIRPVVPFDAALTAPVTEFATVSVKPGADKAKVEELLGILVGGSEGAGAIAASWGRSHEKESDLWLIIGWPSLEAHTKAISGGGSPKAVEFIGKVRELADITVQHVSLVK